MRFISSLFSALTLCRATFIHEERQIPANSAVFLAKFCFDFDRQGNDTGLIDLKVKGVEPQTGTFKIVLLDDQRSSYPDSSDRWPGYDCDDEKLKTTERGEWIVNAENLQSSNWIHTPIIEKIRPRYWFLVALDCSGVSRTIEYELHMLNLEQGWQQEISIDHVGVVSLCSFLLAYLAAGLLQFHAVFLRGTQANWANTKHPLRLMLTAALWSALWGIGFYTFNTVWHAVHGEDSILLYLAAKLCKMVSKFTLFMILMLLSRGRCISRQLQMRDIMYGAVVMFPFLTACLGFEMWGEYDRSQTYTTNFIYDTWLGGVLVFADVVLLCLYLFNLKQSYHREDNEALKTFYKVWGCVFSTAFLSLPATMIVAHQVAAHVRVEWMFIITNIIHIALLVILVFGLWPNNTHEAFKMIDKGTELACTFGNKTGTLLDDEPKSGDYQEFDMAGDQI
jgi:hypothetical protein